MSTELLDWMYTYLERDEGIVVPIKKMWNEWYMTHRETSLADFTEAVLGDARFEEMPGVSHTEGLEELGPEELKGVPSVPGSLPEALDALERDHQFMLKGDVFTQDVIDTWIDYKRKKEVDAVRLRPHPYEFVLYYDM